MSISYTSQRHNNLNYLLRLWILNVLLFVGGLLFIDLFTVFSTRSTPVILIIILSISTWIDIAQKDRVNQVIIDTFNRIIILEYYDINEGQVKKQFSFDEMKIKFFERGVYFSVGKKGRFSISRTKDGFTKESLEEIKNYLEGITSPIGV